MSFDERFRNQLARRLSYTERWLNEAAVDWAALQSSLARCESWPELLNWLACLVTLKDRLRIVVEGEEVIKKAWADLLEKFGANSEPNFHPDIPIVEYAKEVIKRDSPIAELAISRASLMEEEDDGIVVRRLRDDLTIDHAFAWMQEALLSWSPWKPHVDSELFEIQFEGDWPEGEFTGLPSPGDPVKDVDRLIPDSPGHALVVHYYTDKAPSVVEFRQLRSSWTQMEEWFWGDFVIMPIAPTAADWIISYFHHNYLELGRRVGDWPHKVLVDLA